MRRCDLGIFIILVITFLIWSNSFIAISHLLKSLTTFQLVQFRFIPVGIISLFILLVLYRRQTITTLKRHPYRLAISGLLTVIMYNVLLNDGMRYVQPNAASLLVALNPLITLLLAVRFLGEPMSRRRLLGTILSFGGLAVVVLLGKVGNSPNILIPLDKIPYALMVIGAPISWAINTVVIKPALEDGSAVVFNYLSLAMGSLPLVFTVNAATFQKAQSLHGADWGALAFLSIACTVLAFAFWTIAVRHWKASNVSLFVYLNPPLTALFSFLFFKIGITLYFFVGGSLMLVGIMIATLPASFFRMRTAFNR